MHAFEILSLCICSVVLPHITFLGAFAKFQKATVSFVTFVCPSVRPSVRVEQLGSHCRDFHEIWYLSIFQKSVKKIQVLYKYDKNNRYFT
jgi:hypothetical protein